MALVPEGRGIFGELTVRENLDARRLRPPRPRPTRPAISTACWRCFPRLAERLAAAGAHHERRRAADGRDRPRADVGARDAAARRALARPVAAAVRRVVRSALARIRDDGVGMLLVEQNASAEPGHRRPRLSDRDWPHRRRRRSAASLAADPAVQRAYLGGRPTSDGDRHEHARRQDLHRDRRRRQPRARHAPSCSCARAPR